MLYNSNEKTKKEVDIMAERAVTKEKMKIFLKAQQDEMSAVLMYKALADAVRDPADAQAFRQLSAEEGHHAAVFKKLTGKSVKAKKTLAALLPVMYKLIGRKKLYPIIAKYEYDAVKKYAPLAAEFSVLDSVKNDEKRHGDIVLGLLKNS